MYDITKDKLISLNFAPSTVMVCGYVVFREMDKATTKNADIVGNIKTCVKE
jgi:hypothetical protein